MNFKKIIKKKAFTLAEIMLVLIIVSIISVFTIQAMTSMYSRYSNKYMYYSAFTALQTATREIVTNTTDKLIPTTASTSFCDNIITIVNTIGTPACSTNVTSNFSSTNMNFMTSNGMRFYNFGTVPTANKYTVYVDIDGSGRNGKLNDDVMAFNVTTQGTVVPVYDSASTTGPNSTAYLSASVLYLDNSENIVYVDTNATYYKAVCDAYGVYNGATCTQNATCQNQAATGRPCQVLINKPNFFFRR